ncbi:R2R3-MYB protein [Hordeum vulgare]|nr:R2R3-MYB protein [Hordeum vulgare]
MTPPSSFAGNDAGACDDDGSPHGVKKMWTKEEDDLLREQVRRYGGPHNWDNICRALPGRNSKSCRLRWCQHLDPRVEAVKPFTREEDMLIVKYQAAYGNRWSTIAEFLSGRTDNAVKNRWNSVLRKRQEHAPSQQGQTRSWLLPPPVRPRAPRGNAAAAAPPSDMSCGLGDPLTELRIWPEERVVFDVMPLQAYRM